MISKPLIEQIIEIVNSELLIAIFSKAFRGFNRDELAIPINTLLLSFMPAENKTSYFEDENATVCEKTEFTLKMTVFAPATRKGEQVQAIAEIVSDFLADIYIGDLVSYTIGDLSYDDGVNALTLTTLLKFRYLSCPLEGSSEASSNVVPDTFFCKEHVNNTDVHLTDETRAYINEPFIIGSYTGVGGDTVQDITLGFRPKAVFVYRNSYHIANYDSTDGASNCYCAFAFGTTYTRGILISDTGFRVRTVTSSSVTAHINDDGGSYTYIAFK